VCTILKVSCLGVAKSNSQIARDIMQEHGVRGFFTGLVPRILKVGTKVQLSLIYFFFKIQERGVCVAYCLNPIPTPRQRIFFLSQYVDSPLLIYFDRLYFLSNAFILPFYFSCLFLNSPSSLFLHVFPFFCFLFNPPTPQTYIGHIPPP
jgi:hypothetical protein